MSLKAEGMTCFVSPFEKASLYKLTASQDLTVTLQQTAKMLFFSNSPYDVPLHRSGMYPWLQYGAPCVSPLFVLRSSSHRPSVLLFYQTGTIRRNDVLLTWMRRHYVASTSLRRIDVNSMSIRRDVPAG